MFFFWSSSFEEDTEFVENRKLKQLTKTPIVDEMVPKLPRLTTHQLLPPVINADLTKYNVNSSDINPLFPSPVKRSSPQIRTLNNNLFTVPNIQPGPFDGICESFLKHSCSDQQCLGMHELPSIPVVQEFLKNSKTQPLAAYDRLVRKYFELFRRYFPTYADYFGQLKMIDRLLTAIKDCEHHNLIGYWHHLFLGMKKADITSINAIQHFVNVFNKNKSIPAFDHILDLMISSGPMETIHFINNIRYFMQTNPSYKIPVNILIKFLKSAISSQCFGLICFTLEYLHNYDIPISQISGTDLTEFLDLCKLISQSITVFPYMTKFVLEK